MKILNIRVINLHKIWRLVCYLQQYIKSNRPIILGCMSGLCLAFLAACVSGSTFTVDSFETADRVIREQLLPKIQVETVHIPDAIAQRYTTQPVADPLPNLQDFPLYGAQPPDRASNTLYLEIFGSADKSNAKRQEERWLVDVAEAFNQKQATTRSGKVIQIGVRNLPSGIAARLLTSGAAKPAAYIPTNALWLQMLRQQGIKFTSIAQRLAPCMSGFVLQDQVYRDLAKAGEVNFERVLDAILAGKLQVGYTNPYSSSTALNFLYTLFWYSANHAKDGKSLTVSDLQLPQINSTFSAFQNQVLVTSATTLELKEVFIRDYHKLQIIVSDSPSYETLRKLPDMENLIFIPFGIPQEGTLVSFDWNTPEQVEALRQFSQFALSPVMQGCARALGYQLPASTQNILTPPLPSGQVLQAAQSYWKKRKDGGRSVYMMVVVDTSGSMEGERLNALKQSLQRALQEINLGNYVGLLSFSDRPHKIVSLAPFDTSQHQRLLAAIDHLRADGNTALYDGVIVGLAELMNYRKKDLDGRFYLLLLSNGEVNRGLRFEQVQGILTESGVRLYPVAYGEVNQQEMKAIAALREATVKSGTPQNLQNLLKDFFQTAL